MVKPEQSLGNERTLMGETRGDESNSPEPFRIDGGEKISRMNWIASERDLTLKPEKSTCRQSKLCLDACHHCLQTCPMATISRFLKNEKTWAKMWKGRKPRLFHVLCFLGNGCPGEQVLLTRIEQSSRPRFLLNRSISCSSCS